ncbi:MAG: alpha/beta hydrolase [Coriobacteriales bacterium]|nr:alpha/beta hydrolase [Coriobacteriales bacterium]
MLEYPLATEYIGRPDGRLAYDDTGGSGPLVLCIPGMGDLRSQFRLLRPQLVAAGYRVMTMDLRGAGESSASWPSYTPRDVAEDARALLEAHADATPAFVVGNSMAAASALCLAAAAPDLVRALVLVGPVARDHPNGKVMSAAYHVAIDAGFLVPWGPNAWATYYRGLYPDYDESGEPHDLEEHIALIKRNLGEPGRLKALRKFMLASKSECTGHIGEVHVPVLAIAGSLDPDVPDPLAELEWLADELGAETMLLEDVGHYPHVEMVQVSGPAIVGFLGRVLAGGKEPCAPGRDADRA